MLCLPNAMGVRGGMARAEATGLPSFQHENGRQTDTGTGPDVHTAPLWRGRLLRDATRATIADVQSRRLGVDLNERASGEETS